MNKTRTIISLTGGLGNQLFQLTAALYFGGAEHASITSKFGLPRSHAENLPDVFAYRGARALRLEADSVREESWLLRRIANFYMRRSTGTSPMSSKLSNSILDIFFSSLISKYLKMKCEIVTPLGIGFDSSEMLIEKNYILFGYFQTFRYAADDRVLPFLRSLGLDHPTPWITEMVQLAKTEAPIIIHIRMTDYRTETFGIPTRSYYSQALEYLRGIGEAGRIWIFSDEIEAAQKHLGEELCSDARIIHEPAHASPTEILEVMRLAHAYIIANSTFSWWAAFLSHTNAPKVCFPTPWFDQGAQPTDLCPPAWTPIDR